MVIVVNGGLKWQPHNWFLVNLLLPKTNCAVDKLCVYKQTMRINCIDKL